MSYTVTLSGKSNVLKSQFNPPIYLDDRTSYEIGLVNFSSFNTIPNVDETNNVFVWGSTRFEIPVGAYELDDITKILNKHMKEHEADAYIEITPDLNTAKVHIKSNHIIKFQEPNSIASLLGFDAQEIPPNNTYTSEHPVNIIKVYTIGIDCNIAAGSYLNGQPVHIIHQFTPTIPFGYKLVNSPQTILYYPVSVKTINNIIVKIIDQRGNLVDFQKEEVTVTLHIRKSE